MSIVSLVMATIGRVDEPLRFLESLSQQSRQPHELIIVDQNDDDRLATMEARAKELGIRFHRFKETVKNLSHARNRGIVMAKGDIIGFPDDDCWYEPDVIEYVEERFSTDNTISAVSGLWLEAPPQNLPEGHIDVEDMLRFRGARINSITLFVRRDELIALNGFDPRLGTGQWYGAGEETDMALRLGVKNKKIYYAPEVRVHHPYKLPSKISLKLACSKARSRARGPGALYAKHELGPITVVRGCLLPIVKSILPPYQLSKDLVWLCRAVGRLQGWLAWRSRYGSGERSWDGHMDVEMFKTRDVNSDAC